MPTFRWWHDIRSRINSISIGDDRSQSIYDRVRAIPIIGESYFLYYSLPSVSPIKQFKEQYVEYLIFYRTFIAKPIYNVIDEILRYAVCGSICIGKFVFSEYLVRSVRGRKLSKLAQVYVLTEIGESPIQFKKLSRF